LPHVDLLFVDGYHTAEQARFDYEAFAPLLTEKSLALFHDSCSDRVSKIYGPENAYRYTVRDYLAELKRDPHLQPFDLPFGEHGLDVSVSVAPTAWMVPERLLNGEVHFAVMPWTRVAAARAAGEPLVTICGSGHEEAAIVVRAGLRDDEVRKVAIPQRGGI